MLAFDRGPGLPGGPRAAAAPCRCRPTSRGGVADAQDRADYQTLFARGDGAVAAPTAGLHFTPELLARARRAPASRTASVTLHVGAGTFLPVKADDTDEHRMHAEWGEVPTQAAARDQRGARARRRIVAVGTTALRLLEAAARDGRRDRGRSTGETDIFITPGYRFRAVDLLLTNSTCRARRCSCWSRLRRARAHEGRLRARHRASATASIPTAMPACLICGDDVRCRFELARHRRRGAARPASRTAHGTVETPAFMPVGTAGTVKAMTPQSVRRDRRRDRARQHLPPDAAAGRRAGRARWAACTLHELAAARS